MTLEGELVASSTGHASGYAPGERVFHQKFGYGMVAEVDGNKLTIDFDKAGRKRVVDSFVARADQVYTVAPVDPAAIRQKARLSSVRHLQ